jgi:hypothetical protein
MVNVTNGTGWASMRYLGVQHLMSYGTTKVPVGLKCSAEGGNWFVETNRWSVQYTIVGDVSSAYEITNQQEARNLHTITLFVGKDSKKYFDFNGMSIYKTKNGKLYPWSVSINVDGNIVEGFCTYGAPIEGSIAPEAILTAESEVNSDKVDENSGNTSLNLDSGCQNAEPTGFNLYDISLAQSTCAARSSITNLGLSCTVSSNSVFGGSVICQDSGQVAIDTNESDPEIIDMLMFDCQFLGSCSKVTSVYALEIALKTNVGIFVPSGFEGGNLTPEELGERWNELFMMELAGDTNGTYFRGYAGSGELVIISPSNRIIVFRESYNKN